MTRTIARNLLFIGYLHGPGGLGACRARAMIRLKGLRIDDDRHSVNDEYICNKLYINVSKIQ